MVVNRTNTNCTDIAELIVSINVSDSGQSCENHEHCGIVVTEYVKLRVRQEHIITMKGSNAAIDIYWVTDGTNKCKLGFLKEAYLNNVQYDDALMLALFFE